VRIISLGILFAITLLSAVENLGTNGSTYSIKEPNFQIEMSAGITKLQNSKEFSKEGIKKKIVEKINAQSRFDSSLPLCQETRTRKLLNNVSVPEDIHNPAGRLVYRKGDLVLVKNPVEVSMAFLSATNPYLLIKNMNEFKTFSKNTMPGGKTALITGADIRNLKSKELLSFIYPSSREMEKAFNVRCYPTFVRLKGTERLIIEKKATTSD